MLIWDTGGMRQVYAFEQFPADVCQQIVIRHAHVAPAQAVFDLGVRPGTAVVHQDDRSLMARRHACQVWIGAQAPHIVDQMRPGLQRSFCHSSLVGVYGDGQIELGCQSPHHRQHPAQFFCGR